MHSQLAMNPQFIVATLAAVGACGLLFLRRHGLFKRLSAERKRLGGYVIIYENFVGPYSNVGPIFQRMYKLGKEYKGGRCLDCGFYFDDPDAVPSSECRASIGAIVFEGVDENGLQDAKKRALEHPIVKDNNLKVGIFPETECLSVEFPFHGLISILIGVKRCYAELTKHRKFGIGNVCSSLEVYDTHKHKVLFTMPLDERQDLLPFDIKKGN